MSSLDTATTPTRTENGPLSDDIAVQALRHRSADIATVGLFSSVVSILTLTGSVYMLQVYDRVLLSSSVETLVVLSALALIAFALQGALDLLRARILGRIGARVDEELSPHAFRAAIALPLSGASPTEALQPVRDVDQVRMFLGGTGLSALFDLPFMPIFIAGCFLLHPWLGIFAVCGAFLLIALTALSEAVLRSRAKDANESVLRRFAFADSARRHAEGIQAMGMRGALLRRWTLLGESARDTGLGASDIQSGLGAVARIFRVILQSGILGLGAYLAIRQEISGGAMIAASVMVSRALAPVETSIANWRSFVAVRQALGRLKTSLRASAEPAPMALPAPSNSLRVKSVTVSAPGRSEPILVDASFDLVAGAGLAIIGPSGAGKSSLARALVGLWLPTKGDIRLDGATLTQWNPDTLGRHVGFLPQDLALPDGTIAETIARHDPASTPDEVIKAARSAGAHELILRFPAGYATRIGDGGAFLSAGQRQRIGLARALYGDPFLLVLDEPNSNLDAEGDEALSRAIREVRQRGGIAIVITHRPSTLTSVDLVALVMDKTIKLFGPKDQVLRELSSPNPSSRPSPVHVVQGGRSE